MNIFSSNGSNDVVALLRKRKWFLICGVCILVACICCCAFFRLSSLSDVVAYYGMAKNHDPIMRDFALRNFDKGDLMSNISQKYPTRNIFEFGRFSMLRDYYRGDPSNRTSLQVFAKDGKLVRADAQGEVNGVPWDYVFFRSTNDTEMYDELKRVFERYSEQWHQNQNQKR